MLRAKFAEAELFKRVVSLTEGLVGDSTAQIKEEDSPSAEWTSLGGSYPTFI